MGFKGSKKNTPFAAQVAAENAAKTAYDMGLRKVDVLIKQIFVLDPVTRKVISEERDAWIFPAKHFVISKPKQKDALKNIRAELARELAQFEKVLPQLRSLLNTAEAKPVINFYEGVEGIKKVY